MILSIRCWLCAAGVVLLASCAALPFGTSVTSAPPAPDAHCGFDPARLARTEALVRQAVSRGHAPGVVFDLRCQGRPLLAVVAGLADVERQRASRADDLFRIYSMSKPITSLAAMMLVEDGRLSLDDAVAKHLPEFAHTPVYEGSHTAGQWRTVAQERPLTVRDLLRHTAGMGYLSALPHPVIKLYVQKGIDHGGGNAVVPSDGSVPVDSAAELSRRIASLPLLNQPGSRHTYGNATDVLGHLVAVVAKQPLRDFMAQRIFTPLGMVDTGFEVPAAQLVRLTAAYGGESKIDGAGRVLRRGALADIGPSKLGLLDDPAKSVFARRRAIDFGGAGLLSTAADYQRFMLMLLGGGALNGQRLLSAQGLAQMTRNQLDAPALAASALAAQGLGFGLGFATYDEPAKSPGAVPRGGYFWGGAASTHFWVDPARGVSAVFMSQVFGGDVGPYFVEVMDVLYGPP